MSDHHSDKKWIGPTPHHEPLNPVFLVFKSELEVLSGLSVEKCWQNSIQNRILQGFGKLDYDKISGNSHLNVQKYEHVSMGEVLHDLKYFQNFGLCTHISDI